MDQKQVISRLGCFTSSEIGKLLQSGKAKDKIFGDTATTYIWEKAAEVINGEKKKSATSVEMAWGIEHEKDAFLTFQQSGYDECIYYGAENFKYFVHPEIALTGGSPDGLVSDAALELKSPYNSANHLKALVASKGDNHNEWLKKYKPEYYAQLQWNIVCTETRGGYFVSYDPRTVDHKHRLAVLRIDKDEELIKNLTERVHAAIAIVNGILTTLK